MTQTVLRRVLIVDDESSIRDMVAITLEMAGFEVVQAIDASAALNEIATLQPEMIISPSPFQRENWWRGSKLY